MAKGKISVQAENIFPIIKKFLYTDQEIFLRELISNAVDATSKLKTLASKGVYKGELGDLTIQVSVDKDDKTITISDKGIGMTKEEIKKYLNQVAFSSAEEFIEKYKEDANIIGHFGLGFYSAFMVADRVEVHSKSYNGEDAVKWECDGNPEYIISKSSKKDRGTDIILHVSDDAKEYLEESKIEQLLNKYCKFLPVPIQFGTKKVSKPVKEGEDPVEEEVPNIINNTHPLWKKQPTELTDQDYIDFYNELYPYHQPPLFWIHLNIDYPFNLAGVLYFPKVLETVDLKKNKIQLYSNQVFVTDNVEQIVPEFLTLLHGVIDSPDIPLNVSRSSLQADSNVKKITSYITKKVAEKLKSLFKENREEFEKNWSEIGTFVKYGMMSEPKFHDRAMDFVLLKNIEDKYFTIEEYKEKIKDIQKDKNDRLIFIYTNNPKDHHGYIEAVKNYGYDVLVMDNIIDPHFMQHLEYKLGDVTFVRVDADTPDKLVDKDENKESVLSEKDQEKVKTLFEEALGDLSGGSIELRALSPDDHPVLITKPEFMRRMKEMQMLQGMRMGDMQDMHNVIINTNHPLIAQKLIKMKSKDKKRDFARYLHDLAKLNQNMLKGEDMSQFIKRSIDFLNN